MGPWTSQVDKPCQQLFACSAFAMNQDGGLTGGHSFYRAQESHHPRILAEQCSVFHLMNRPTESAPFLTACFEIGNRPFQHIHGKWLQQILAGSQLHGLNGGFNRPIGRHEDNRRLRGSGLHLLDQLETSEARHAQIGQDQPRTKLCDPLQCLRPINRSLHGIAESPDGFHQGDTHRRIVVNDQNPFLLLTGFCRRDLLLTVSHKTNPP